MAKRLTTEEFIEKANKIHKNKYDYSKTVYVRSRDKVKIICPEHGAFEQRASSHLEGVGCPKCAKIWSDEHKENHKKAARKSRGFSQEEWIEVANNVHNGKYIYDLVDYINKRTKVRIICPTHGEFLQEAGSHLRGIGCPECGAKIARPLGYTWTKEQHEKIEKTCMERYGAKRYLDSVEGKKKLSRIMSSDSVRKKVYRTKRKNNSFNTSKPEEKMFLALNKYFCSDNVVRQYVSKKYPFRCDFYIKSLDLYIELNAHWTHHKHYFGTGKNDHKLLKTWEKRSQRSGFYKDAIFVWTERDILKRNTALKNNLNYLVFWKNNLSDFYEWLANYNKGNIILNNLL